MKSVLFFPRRARCGRFGALLLALLFAFSSYPVAAKEDAPETPYYSDSVDWNQFRGQNISINVYNWGEYISVDDGEEGGYDLNAAFEALTGVKVNYTNFASNEEMYAKLKSGGASYDVIIPSDYMIARLIHEDMLEELDFSHIPNFSMIRPDLVNPGYDPQNRYSVPYTWGVVGLIYNKTLVDEEDDVATWNILWNEKYAGNILMFSNSRDAFAISLWRLGFSANTTNTDELDAAARALTDQKMLVQAYVMDEIFDKMGGGEAAIAPYYAGDAVTMLAENPDLAFVLPREKTNLFVDAACIPKGAKNQAAAELYINFLCETYVAYKTCEYIGYSTPHVGAYALLDDETKNGISYPDEQAIANMEAFIALPNVTTRYMDNLWTSVMSTTSTNPWMAPIFLVVAIGLIILLNVTRRLRQRRNEEQNHA